MVGLSKTDLLLTPAIETTNVRYWTFSIEPTDFRPLMFIVPFEVGSWLVIQKLSDHQPLMLRSKELKVDWYWKIQLFNDLHLLKKEGVVGRVYENRLKIVHRMSRIVNGNCAPINQLVFGP